MAEIVQIDIPGIGLVDAKNAASEKTLNEILKLLQQWNGKLGKGTGGPGGAGKTENNNGGDDGGGGGGGGGGPGGLRKTATSLVNKMKFVGGAFVGIGEASSRAVAGLANLGDSLESVASLFANIPIAGSLFQAAASAAERVVKSFNDASQSGASFGGSLNAFAGAASQAGMTLSEFGSLLSKNGQGLLAFGTTTEAGAKNFARLSKTLRATGSDLYALGFSTAEINQGLASYGALVRLQGQQGKVSNDQLVAGARKYMRELDALAKITGEDRKAKEEQMKALATDAQFQMAMAGKSQGVRDQFMKLVGGFGPKLGGFVKDYIATGTLTTEANQKLGAMLGGDVMNELTTLRQKMLSNQELTDEEKDRLKAIMKKAAQANSEMAGTALAANRDMDDASQGLIEALQLNENAHTAATAAQNSATGATDGTNEAVNKMKERIAQVSNAFTMFLVNSGILEQMMRAFELLVGIIQKFAIPVINLMMGVITVAIDVISKLASIVLPILTQAFSYLTGGLTNVVSTIDQNVNPAFSFLGEVIETVGDIIETYVKPALVNFAAFIVADVWPVLKLLGETVLYVAENVIYPAFQMVGGIIRDYVYPALSAVAGFLADNFFPILTMVGAGLVGYYGVLMYQKAAAMAQAASAWLASGGLSKAGAAAGAAAFSLGMTAKAAFAAALPFIKIVAPIVALVGLFTYLYKTGWSFGDVLEAVGDNIKKFYMTMAEGLLWVLDKVTFGEANEKIKMAQALVAEQKKELEEREKARDERRAQKAKERGFQDREQVADQMSLKLGQQNLNLGQQQLGLQQEQIAATEKELNLSGDPHALLKDLAKKEGSAFVKPGTPSSPQTSVAGPAESSRRSMEQEAEQKRTEEQKAREAQQRLQQQAPAGTPSQPAGERPASTQETLIASINKLNTNMERMVAQQSRSNTLLTDQVRATTNVAGAVSNDLFQYPMGA